MGFKDFVVKTEEKPKVVEKEQQKDGFFLNVAQVGYLGGLFGLPVKSAEDLLDKVRRTQTVRFLGKTTQEEGLEIALEVEDLWAIKQLATGMGKDFRDYAKEFIEDAVSKDLYGCIKTR